jgi:hypothetical protein
MKQMHIFCKKKLFIFFSNENEIKANPNPKLQRKFLLSSNYRVPFLGPVDYENKVFVSCKHIFVVIQHFKSFRCNHAKYTMLKITTKRRHS